MLISELTVYDFLKDKIKLSDSDAKRYAKEMSLAEEKVNIKIDNQIQTKFKEHDYVTKSDLVNTKLELITKIAELDARMEKGNKEIIVWVIAFLTGIIGIAVAIIKLF